MKIELYLDGRNFLRIKLPSGNEGLGSKSGLNGLTLRVLRKGNRSTLFHS
jgi:hypothetical protein